jgi:uncharacterized iron-regulated protein
MLNLPPRARALAALATLAVLAGCSAAATPPAQSASAAAPPSAVPPRVPLPADVVAKSALPLYVLAGDEKLCEPELWDRLAASRVICFGEQHDSPAHHYAEQRALEELAKHEAAARQPLAVGFEMFQLPYQAALSGFVSGSLPEAQFLTDTQYKERWGFDFALYRPLLDTARQYKLPALALNTPRELTRKIGHSGLDSLEPAERSQLPELDLGNADHKAYFEAAMSEHPMPPGGPRLADMYAAQVVWDETMANSSATWLRQAGDTAKLIVFAGAGHCHKSAIPARITRRIQLPVLSVSPVLASQLAQFKDRARYDWLVVLDDSAPVVKTSSKDPSPGSASASAP